MTQPVKALATKPGGLCLIPGTHIVEEEGVKKDRKLFPDPYTYYMAHRPHPMHM